MKTILRVAIKEKIIVLSLIENKKVILKTLIRREIITGETNRYLIQNGISKGNEEVLRHINTLCKIKNINEIVFIKPKNDSDWLDCKIIEKHLKGELDFLGLSNDYPSFIPEIKDLSGLTWEVKKRKVKKDIIKTIPRKDIIKTILKKGEYFCITSDFKNITSKIGNIKIEVNQPIYQNLRYVCVYQEDLHKPKNNDWIKKYISPGLLYHQGRIDTI